MISKLSICSWYFSPQTSLRCAWVMKQWTGSRTCSRGLSTCTKNPLSLPGNGARPPLPASHVFKCTKPLSSRQGNPCKRTNSLTEHQLEANTKEAWVMAALEMEGYSGPELHWGGKLPPLRLDFQPYQQEISLFQSYCGARGTLLSCYVAAWMQGWFGGKWIHGYVWLSLLAVHQKGSQHC